MTKNIFLFMMIVGGWMPDSFGVVKKKSESPQERWEREQQEIERKFLQLLGDIPARRLEKEEELRKNIEETQREKEQLLSQDQTASRPEESRPTSIIEENPLLSPREKERSATSEFIELSIEEPSEITNFKRMQVAWHSMIASFHELIGDKKSAQTRLEKIEEIFNTHNFKPHEKLLDTHIRLAKLVEDIKADSEAITKITTTYKNLIEKDRLTEEDKKTVQKKIKAAFVDLINNLIQVGSITFDPTNPMDPQKAQNMIESFMKVLKDDFQLPSDELITAVTALKADTDAHTLLIIKGALIDKINKGKL